MADSASSLVEMIDGSLVSSSTASSKTRIVEHPCISFALCVQPTVMVNLNNKMCILDGLRNRFHMHCHGTVPQDDLAKKKYPNDFVPPLRTYGNRAVARIEDICRSVLAQPAPLCNGRNMLSALLVTLVDHHTHDKFSVPSAPVVRMSAGVFKHFNDLKNSVWKGCKEMMGVASASSPFAKQESNVLVLAANFCFSEKGLELLTYLQMCWIVGASATKHSPSVTPFMRFSRRCSPVSSA